LGFSVHFYIERYQKDPNSPEDPPPEAEGRDGMIIVKGFSTHNHPTGADGINPRVALSSLIIKHYV
jgi:hypothetical protein